jgi:hypothetical protein
VGGLVGTVAGAFAGGLAGHAAAERFDPTVEDAYWRENFEREAYYEPGMTYDDYWPAYRLGYEARARYPEMEFVDIEIQLAEDYEKSRGKSRLGWDRARHAVRAAWDRIEHAVKGKSGKDAR